MKSKILSTKSDIVVLLACTLMLLANIGAIGRSGRSKARDIVCRANLKKWGLAFAAYAEDYDGYNPYGGWAHSWWSQVLPYIQPDANDRKLFFCPTATKTTDPQPFTTWSYGTAPPQFGGGRYTGSYGVNPWIFSYEGYLSSFGGINPEQWRWKKAKVAGADNVPVFGDCTIVGDAAQESDIPPEFRDSSQQERDGIGKWCLDRHDCAINMAFMDWSARKVPLKCLWKIKWHRQFDTESSGPVENQPYPTGWPDWMSRCQSCD